MKHRAIIGIDISPDEIRGACVRMVAGSPQLSAVASVPTPPGAIDEEGMLDTHEVSEAIRRICAQLEPRPGGVVVGITNCSLVARVMEIPPVPDAEVRAVLRGEMDHYRILPAGQSAFDFYRLPESTGRDETKEAPEGEAISRVLLMGAEERLVASYRAAIDASSLKLIAVEPGAIAAVRALYPMLAAETAVATVNVSATGTDVFITQAGSLQFYRRVDTGIPELRAHVAAPDDQPASAAPQVRGGLLVQDDDEFEAAPVVRAQAAPTEPFNRQAISLLMTEVQRSLDYFSREFPVGEDHVIVRFAIDAPDASDLFRVMAQYLRSDAEMATALESAPVSDEARGSLGGAQGFRYIVAVGLALRGAGGDYDLAPALNLSIGDKVVVERRMAPRVMWASVAASGFLLAGTIASAWVVGNTIGRLDQRLNQGNHELKALTAEHAVKVAKLERQQRLVSAIHAKDKPMREAVEFLSAAVAKRASLTAMTMEPNGTIILNGEALNTRTVADIMDSVNLSNGLEPVQLKTLTRIEPQEGGTTFRFDLQTAFAASPAPSPSTASAPNPASSAPAGAAKGGS